LLLAPWPCAIGNMVKHAGVSQSTINHSNQQSAMNNIIYFTPGPSELYPSVTTHLATAWQAKLGSISHRGQQFKELYAHAVTGLRHLLQLPPSYHVLFLSSANEIWERAIQNNVEHESFHLVNGAFSNRFYQVAQELGRKARRHAVELSQGFALESIAIPHTAELVGLIHNETSTGACMPVADINKFRDMAPAHALIYVDAVSSLPIPAFDYDQVDAVYFSVQKGFGLPAGLGVWLLNDRCIAKAEALQHKGLSLGSYHSLPAMLAKATVNQTVETPNVLGIYLLGKVAEDMNQKGIDLIRQETEEKARLMYAFLDKSRIFSPAVTDAAYQSITTIVADTSIAASEVNKRLAAFGMQIGSGYGDFKEKQVRIANFPAHTLEQIQKLVDTLEELFG